jgi:translocation and assembly module TamA
MKSQPKLVAPTLFGALPATVVLALCLLAPVAVWADVELVGLDETIATNVRLLLPLSESGCDSARWRVERLFRDADKNINEALEALGYYEPKISKSLAWSDDCWHARFEVQTGTPVLIKSSNVTVLGEGVNDPDLLPKVRVRRPAIGDVLNHGAYEAYKSDLLRTAINAGYFDADFERNTISVDRDARTADIDLEMQSGGRYVFGEVKFTEGIIRHQLLQRYTDIRAGDPYSSRSINELYEALSGSAYFASVSISTEPLNTKKKIVPVNVNLTPVRRHLYSIGGGFATDTGPQGRMGYTNRRVNDKGHQFESKFFVSPVQSQLNATYRWPKDNPRKDWISIVTGAQHENTDTSQSDTFKLGVLRTRALSKTWLETRYVDYQLERYKIADQNTSSQLIIIGNNWENEKGRSLSRVIKGHRLSFDVRGASDSLGSDTSFLQLQVKARLIRSLGQKTRILARTTLAGTVKDSLSELPVSVRYFAGGDRSIRGYDFESLGPTNADGEVIGGSYLLEASLEVDRLFREKWGIAAFVDSGSAFSSSDFSLSTGVGIGLRWYSPVGPIRLDVAHPLDDPNTDVRLHISIGPDL